MFEKLLLKSIGARLVSEGDCPYDPHCVHAGFGSCLADKNTLKGMEVKLKEQAQKESHSGRAYSIGGTADDYDPDTVFTRAFVKMESGIWPCAEAQVYSVIIPIELWEGDDLDA